MKDFSPKFRKREAEKGWFQIGKWKAGAEALA